MTIEQVVVTSREDAQPTISHLRDGLGKRVCWITVCNRFGGTDSTSHVPLVRKSQKHILVMKFQDVNINPITKNQARKIKNFILNHHLNQPKDSVSFVLVINCRAGISRSTAIGKFCELTLNLPVEYKQLQFQDIYPNSGVMEALGMFKS
jgi:hypothetical protein